MKDNKDKREAQKSTLGKVLKRIKKYSGFLVISILMAAVTVASTLYVPILVGRGIDHIIGPGNVDFAGITKVLITIGIVVAITALSQWIMNICNNKITYHVTRDIRDEAMEKLQKLPLKYIDAQSYGDIVSRVIADVDQFADGLLMGFTQFFSGVLTIAGTLIFMLTINVKITLVVVVITPVSLFVASFIAKKTFSMFKLQSETRGEQTAFIDEMIGGQKVVKAYGYEDRAVEEFDEINKRLQKYSLRAIFFSSITNPSTRFVNSLVYAAVAVAGAFSAIGGGITVGQLSSFLSYATQYTKPFNEISGVITELQNAIDECAATSNSFDEFQSKLLEQFQISVIDHRGRYSYLHPDRQKRITERSLGTRYGKEHLKQTFLRKDPLAILYVRSHLRLVVNLQTNVKAMQSPAYAHRVKLSNLQQMANTIIYVQEHGFDTQSDLKNTLLASKQELKEMQTQFAQHRSNLRTLNDQIRYTGQYYANKEVYSQFLL
jgi:ATP-binding cassette subfamily B protein